MKQISPALAYVERENFPSGGEIFALTRFLARPVGHIINIHGSNMYHNSNTVEIISTAKDPDKSGDGSKISNDNVLNITKEHLNDAQKQ